MTDVSYVLLCLFFIEKSRGGERSPGGSIGLPKPHEGNFRDFLSMISSSRPGVRFSS
jgi:hypothetical protein